METSTTNYHIDNILSLISKFNSSFENVETVPDEVIENKEKEYKMPFELKVFKKRVKKHNFYRNRNKPKDTTEYIDWVDDAESTLDENQETEFKWSKLGLLEKKKALKDYLKSLNLSKDGFRLIFKQLWDACRMKFVKTRHVKVENGVISHITGMELVGTQWCFNHADLL